MVNCYIKKGNRLNVIEGIEFLENSEDKNSVIWIDMLLPSIEEVRAVEEMFDIEFPTKQETEEIELPRLPQRPRCRPARRDRADPHPRHLGHPHG